MTLLINKYFNAYLENWIDFKNTYNIDVYDLKDKFWKNCTCIPVDGEICEKILTTELLLERQTNLPKLIICVEQFDENSYLATSIDNIEICDSEYTINLKTSFFKINESSQIVDVFTQLSKQELAKILNDSELSYFINEETSAKRTTIYKFDEPINIVNIMYGAFKYIVKHFTTMEDLEQEIKNKLLTSDEYTAVIEEFNFADEIDLILRNI